MNASRYFELFQLARLPMPLFSIVGGLAVFAWSRRLYGTLGGLLSLALWVFCPNILAHARLVTSDLGSTALGVAATYVFWRYLHQPSWRWAAAAGVMLGLAQLTKFSMLLLYAVWPFLWLVRLVLVTPRAEWPSRHPPALGHGFVIVRPEHRDDRRRLFLRGRGNSAGQVRVRLEVADAAGDAGDETRRTARTCCSKRPGSSASIGFAEPGWSGIPCPLPEHYSWASTSKRSRPRESRVDSSRRSAVPTSRRAPG